ncbi:unnamed protein product, partial [Cylicocyclus nassatus]
MEDLNGEEGKKKEAETHREIQRTATKRHEEVNQQRSEVPFISLH